jgi:hypothetical protein
MWLVGCLVRLGVLPLLASCSIRAQKLPTGCFPSLSFPNNPEFKFPKCRRRPISETHPSPVPYFWS